MTLYSVPTNPEATQADKYRGHAKRTTAQVLDSYTFQHSNRVAEQSKREAQYTELKTCEAFSQSPTSAARVPQDNPPECFTSKSIRSLEDVMQYSNYKDSVSPFVQLVSALEQLERVEQYLYATTYASDGAGSRCYSQWYKDIEDAVSILRVRVQNCRVRIAKRINATLN